MTASMGSRRYKSNPLLPCFRVLLVSNKPRGLKEEHRPETLARNKEKTLEKESETRADEGKRGRGQNQEHTREHKKDKKRKKRGTTVFLTLSSGKSTKRGTTSNDLHDTRPRRKTKQKKKKYQKKRRLNFQEIQRKTKDMGIESKRAFRARGTSKRKM